ncbi:Metabotropic glutamate receptor 8, partial [Podila humilis]
AAVDVSVAPATPPKELFPGILDPGPIPEGTLVFGILMPLNLTQPAEAYWRTLAINGITAIRLAVEDINAEKLLPVDIAISIRNSQPPSNNDLSASNAMLQAAMFVSNNVSAVIGDTRSWLTEFSASLTSSLRIPQCSFTSMSDSLSSKVLYDHFIRTVSTTEVIARQMLAYLRLLGWRRIGILHSDDSYGRSFNNDLLLFAASYGFTITLSEVIYIPQSHQDEISATLEMVREMGSYINILATSDTGVMRALEDIYKAGMLRLPYTWISINDLQESLYEMYAGPGPPQVTDFDGLLMLSVDQYTPTHPEFSEFRERWANLDPTLYPGAGTTRLTHSETRAYSCVKMLALGYQRDIELARMRGVSEEYILQELKLGSYPRTIGNLTSALFSTLKYDGPAGPIRIDILGNTVSQISNFLQLQGGQSTFMASTSLGNENNTYQVNITGTHIWPGLRPGEIPKDSPEWVIQNISRTEAAAWVMSILTVLGIVACIILIGIVVWKRHNPVIKAASAFFCVLELLGIIIVYTAVLMRMGHFTSASCTALPIVLNFGLSLLLGSLVVKNLRIYRIFNNVFQNKYAISDMKLLRQLCVIVLILMISPAVYLLLLRPQARYISISPTKAAYACVRTNPSMPGEGTIVFGIVSLIPQMAVLAVAGYLAYQTQNVSNKWNESRQIIYIIYTMVLAASILIPTMFLTADQFRITVFTQSIVIICAITLSMLILFVPKLVLMRQLQREREENYVNQTNLDRHTDTVGNLLQRQPRQREAGGERYDEQVQPIDSLQHSFSGADSPRDRRKSSATLYPSIPLQSSFPNQDSPVPTSTTQFETQGMRSTPMTSDSPIGVGDDTERTGSNADDDGSDRQRAASAGMLSLHSGTVFSTDGVDSSRNKPDLGIFSFNVSDETQTVQVQVEYRGWFYRFKKSWEPRRFILISSLATVIIFDNTRTKFKTYLYTRVTSSTEDGHYFLFVACLDYARLKFDFSNELARDQWLLAFDAPSKETADATFPTIARRLSMRARLQSPKTPVVTESSTNSGTTQQTDSTGPRHNGGDQDFDIDNNHNNNNNNNNIDQVYDGHDLYHDTHSTAHFDNDNTTSTDIPTLFPTNQDLARSGLVLAEGDLYGRFLSQQSQFEAPEAAHSARRSRQPSAAYAVSELVRPMTEFNMEQFLSQQSINDNSTQGGNSRLSSSEHISPRALVGPATGGEFSLLDALRLEETDPSTIPERTPKRKKGISRLFRS